MNDGLGHERGSEGIWLSKVAVETLVQRLWGNENKFQLVIISPTDWNDYLHSNGQNNLALQLYWKVED